MNFKEWLSDVFVGHKPSREDDPERVKLDTQQRELAARLARMQGSTRDEVLSEAYRRARLAKEAQSYRPRP